MKKLVFTVINVLIVVLLMAITFFLLQLRHSLGLERMRISLSIPRLVEYLQLLLAVVITVVVAAAVMFVFVQCLRLATK